MDLTTFKENLEHSFERAKILTEKTRKPMQVESRIPGKVFDEMSPAEQIEAKNIVAEIAKKNEMHFFIDEDKETDSITIEFIKQQTK
jgi:hypothetical protein